MSNAKSLGFLRARLEKICDIENDAHISLAEKNDILASAACETADRIIEAGGQEKFVKNVTFNVTPGTSEYPLHSIIASADPTKPKDTGDFYKIHQLYVMENGATQMRPIQRIGVSEVRSFKAPIQSCTMKLYYIPVIKFEDPLGTGSAADDYVIDGINGWEEHTLMTAACAIKFKRDEAYRQFWERKMELEKRISRMGNTDYGEPMRVQRKRRVYTDPWNAYNNNVNAYVLRGDTIELYYLYGYSNL